jgi:hypothetical protein
VAGAGAALAAPAGAEAAVLTVKGGTVLKPGTAIIDNMRFRPLNRAIESGETLTIRNKTGAPHTLSIVNRSQLPRTARQMDALFESPLMGEFMQAHGVDPNNQDAPPQNPIVDVGKEGIDQRGDSVFFAGPTQNVEFSAAAGQRLYYLCLLHPWMQGSLRAK